MSEQGIATPIDAVPELPAEPQPKQAPHSPEIEQAVLSAWCLHERFGKAWKPDPDLFYVKAHRAIASAMTRVDPAVRDMASVLAQLDADGSLASIGGASVVIRVIRAAPAYGDPWPHLNRLRELKALRDLIAFAEAGIAEAYENKNLTATVGKLQDAIRAGSQEIQTKIFSVADLIRSVALSMQDSGADKTCTTGLPTLDRDIGGFQNRHVTILGACTNWGKSAMAIFVSDVNMQRGKRPLIVSAEDPEELYGRRLTARRAQVSPNVLRRGGTQPTDAQWKRVMGVTEKAETKPFFINAIGKTVERIAMDLRCVCAAEPIDIVIVDYLQAIQCSRRQQDRRNEVAYVARVLTDVIKSSGCAGLMFSQLKRPMKEGQKPTKHDLKEAGELENAAENVLVGFMDQDSERVVRVEKAKDGVTFKEYVVGWDNGWCGFTGEKDVIDDTTPLPERDGYGYG